MTSVELITIGDELLLGFTIDTNGAYLARKLAEHGISVTRRTSVGDELDVIANAVREALERSHAVITTGGLGPTSDDVTRDAIAKVFAREMQLDETHLAWMRERWKKRFNRDMPESNRRQAMLPAGARKLDNNHGSAPGMFIEDARGWVATLPGVPRELRGMADDTLLPLLVSRGATGACIRSRTLRTTGVAESLLAERLAEVTKQLGDVSLAYLPGIEGVDLRVTARGPAAAKVDAQVAVVSKLIQEVVGESIYAEGTSDLASVVLDLCRTRKLKIAVAESCTGGLLGARLTAIPGSSDVFLGGVIAYDNKVKTKQLGVDPYMLGTFGAVSEEVVRAMATGVRERFGADVGLSITGIAGPDGGTAEKPVGTVWICAAIGDRVEPRKIHSWGDREEVRYRATQAVLELLRRNLS